MLDIEFTIEKGKLWMLQCRVGKRNGPAAVRMAMDMLKEKLIDAEEAVTPHHPGPARRAAAPHHRPGQGEGDATSS